MEEWEVWLRTNTKEFYDGHILPFVGHVEEEPSRDLLIAVQHEQERKSWSVCESLVVEEPSFTTVGIGGPTARTLLNSLYMPFLSLDGAAIIAAYVIYRVKRSITGCGFDTEIRFILNGGTGIVNPTFIKRCEELFEKYRRIEKEILYFSMNIPLREPIPALPPEFQIPTRYELTTQDIAANLNNLREDFSKLHVFPVNSTQ